jgi:hypothetical protein
MVYKEDIFFTIFAEQTLLIRFDQFPQTSELIFAKEPL